MYDYIIATDEGGNEQDDEDSGSESLQLEEEDCVSCKSSYTHRILSAHFRWLSQLSVVQMQTPMAPVGASAKGHPHHQSRQAVTKNAEV